jgi:hypothetical protein
MQRGVRPLEEKLTLDGEKTYTVESALLALREKIKDISVSDLAVDLLPMFESRTFIETWLENFHISVERYAESYLKG